MDAACSLLFTRTAFARDIHGHIGGGEFADELAHLLDLRRRAQKARQVGRYGQTAAAGFVHDFFGFGGVRFGFAVGDGFHAGFGKRIGIFFSIGNGLRCFVQAFQCCLPFAVVAQFGHVFGCCCFFGCRLLFLCRCGRRIVFFLHLNGRFYQRAQLRQGDGFLQIIECADFQCLHRLVSIAERRNHGNGRVGLLLHDVLHHFQARAVRHTHIGQHQRITVFVQFFLGCCNAFGRVHR